MNRTDKKIISIFLLLMILISQISMVFATETEGTKEKLYVTINDTNDVLTLEDATDTQELYLWAEDYNLSEINFSKLEKLEEIHIYSGQLNGTLSFKENLNLKSIYISLNCDLSNAVINLKEKQELSNVQINLDTSKTKDFSLINTILVENDIYAFTNIDGNTIEYFWAYGMGGSNILITCDTFENYLANFYPDISKENITEIDLEKWGTTLIEDITGIDELTNLKKATLSYIYDWSKIDFEKLNNIEELNLLYCYPEETIQLNKLKKLKKLLIDVGSGILWDELIEFTKVDIRNLENLKEFEYKFEDFGIKDDEGNPHLPKLEENIITDNYSKLKYKEVEHVEGYEDGEDFVWYEKSYYFVIGQEYTSSNSELKIEVIDEKETIKGFSITNNKTTIQNMLDANDFIEDVNVKVLNSNDEEITDTTKGLGTGMKIQLYENEELVQEYTVVIYGDVSGDGTINAFDALTLIKGINNKVPFKGEIYKEAGRIITQSGQAPTALDALAIVKSANNKYIINQSK